MEKPPEKPVRPLKRHSALVEYSRDHHFGLLLVWKIRQGLKNNIEEVRISDYLLYFFQQDLLDHFKDEERDLFTRLPEGDMLTRALNDHKKIYELVESIKADRSNRKLLKEFSDTLELHIRFEERTLFGYLQPLFTEDELSAIMQQHSKKKEDADNTWNDHFWKTSS